MGMFDDVTVRYPLPDPEMQDAPFQTKDLACLGAQYTITRDGVLRGWGRDLEYHGDLTIYAPHPLRAGLMQYHVRFTHGRVESIERDERRLREKRSTPLASRSSRA